eukprot:635317_1
MDIDDGATWLCPLITIMWMITLSSTIYLFILFCSKSKKSIEISPSLHCLSITMYIFVIMASLVKIYHHVVCAVDAYEVDVHPTLFTIKGIIKHVANGSIIIEFIMIMIIFIVRLKICFRSSAFQYPAGFYIFMYINITVITLAAFVGIATGIMFLTVIALFIAMFNCILLTYLFVNGLYKMLKITENDPTAHASVDRRSTIRIIAKCIVLVSCSMCSSGIFLVCLLLDTTIGFNLPMNFWMAIDSLVNTYCVFLQFRFGQQFYDRWCTGCSKFCLQCVAKGKGDIEMLVRELSADHVGSNTDGVESNGSKESNVSAPSIH